MIAFKEWDVVCNAIGAGRQTVILRKGGIHEGREGFAWEHEEFVLFPTHFHAQQQGVKADDWKKFGRKALKEWENGDEVVIKWKCHVRSSRILTDLKEVEAFSEQHVWTQDVVNERFNWEMKKMKGNSITIAEIRVSPLKSEKKLVYHKSLYGGCRSWLKL